MKLAKKELVDLLNNYNLGNLINHKKTRMGVSNYNWIVETTKGKFVLRSVFKDKKLKEINFEFEYLNYFCENGFPYKIPQPLSNKKISYLTRFKNNYFWMYPFIEGEIIERFGKNELKETAKMMAIYHNILKESNLNNSKGQGVPFNKSVILKELEQFKRKCLKKFKKQKKDEIFLSEVDDLIRILKGLDTTIYLKLKHYPIHRDISSENIIFKNKKIVGLIDFDDVSFLNEPLVKDLVILIMYSCRNLKNKSKVDLRLSKLFINEYNKYHKLSNEEVKLIPDLASAGAIEDYSYAFWLLENDPKRAKLKWLKQYAKLAKWFTKNKKLIVDQFSFESDV